MTNAFLLRFQETCKNAPTGPICTGTKMQYLIRAEQADAGPSRNANIYLSSGTKTFTEIGQESGDNDPANRQVETFPRTLS